MALDLEPDEIYQHALMVVKRAERKLWLLRFKISVMKVIRGSADNAPPHSVMG